MRIQVVAAVVVTFGVCASAWAGDAAKGKAIYDGRCAFCHGTAGKGDGPAGGALNPRPTNFASPDYWKTAKRDAMKMTIKNGKPGTAMAPFGRVLGDADIEDILDHLESFRRK